MAGDGPSLLLTREHVFPVLIEHKDSGKHIVCMRLHKHTEVGWAPRALTVFFPQISLLRRVGCVCGRKRARKANGIELRCHVFFLERGIRL